MNPGRPENSADRAPEHLGPTRFTFCRYENVKNLRGAFRLSDRADRGEKCMHRRRPARSAKFDTPCIGKELTVERVTAPSPSFWQPKRSISEAGFLTPTGCLPSGRKPRNRPMMKAFCATRTARQHGM